MQELAVSLCLVDTLPLCLRRSVRHLNRRASATAAQPSSTACAPAHPSVPAAALPCRAPPLSALPR